MTKNNNNENIMRARKEKRNSCIDARSSRASSVQRQTETLRTLGTRREVGSKLHSNPDITSLYSGTSRAASPYRDTGRSRVIVMGITGKINDKSLILFWFFKL